MYTFPLWLLPWGKTILLYQCFIFDWVKIIKNLA